MIVKAIIQHGVLRDLRLKTFVEGKVMDLVSLHIMPISTQDLGALCLFRRVSPELSPGLVGIKNTSP
jgi:hypothetical protein